ncbi:MAG: hypothetical protein R3195_06215 [Gemmatimonadota bacterium]|nr:hypothetical protein [Gemmatimonadota bacterium]
MVDAGDSPAAADGERRDSFGWMALGLAGIHALLGFLLYEPTLFPGGDNAGYMILGEALRSGEGYRDLYLPGAPLHAKYPPGLPILLAGLGWFGGVQLFKAAMLVCTSATVWVTARVGRALIGTGPALVAAGLLALNPTLLEYGHYVLSEAPFVLFVMLAVLATRRDDGVGTALAIAAAAAAFATRTAGLTVLVALPVAWAIRRDFRRAAIGGVAALAIMLGWGLYQGAAAPEQASYLEELVLVDPYNPAAGSVGLAGLVVRAAGNLWEYGSRVIPQTLIGAEGPPSTAIVALGLLFALVALLGWARRARDGLGVAEVFVLLYVGLIAVWPDVWTDRRFLLPAVPLLGIFAVGYLASLPERVPEPIRRLAPLALLLLVAGPALWWTAGRVPERLECLALYRTGSPCDTPALASLYAAASWARENTAEDAIIVNRKPRLFWWYARRQGDLYPYSPDPAVVLGAMDRMGADYVVVDQVSGTTARFLIPAIQSAADRFEPVYEGGNPPTFVFRLHPPSANAE